MRRHSPCGRWPASAPGRSPGRHGYRHLYWIADHLTVVLGVALTLLAGGLRAAAAPHAPVGGGLASLHPGTALPGDTAVRHARLPQDRLRVSPRSAFPGTAESCSEHRPSDLEQVFSRFGLPPATGGNAFELFSDGERAFAAMMDIVRGAGTSLDVTFYLVADDEAGRIFVEALEEKALSGVRVRLIIDRLGDLKRPREALRRLRRAGGRNPLFLADRPFAGQGAPQPAQPPQDGDRRPRARLFRRHERRQRIHGADAVSRVAGATCPTGSRGRRCAPFCDVHDSDWGAIGEPSARGCSRDLRRRARHGGRPARPLRARPQGRRAARRARLCHSCGPPARVDRHALFPADGISGPGAGDGGAARGRRAHHRARSAPTTGSPISPAAPMCASSPTRDAASCSTERACSMPRRASSTMRPMSDRPISTCAACC